MAKQILTQDRLKELIKYNPSTGIFSRAIGIYGARAGDIAGTLDNGYIRIRVEGKRYRAHHLAFLYMTGSFPEKQTDHINGRRSDNAWENLRQVTPSENQKNRKVNRVNKSGACGVNWNDKSGNWRARINDHGKKTHLGMFGDFFEACCARKSAELKYNYHPNHGRRA